MSSHYVPSFQSPTEFLTPQISDLLSDSTFIESGISFKGKSQMLLKILGHTHTQPIQNLLNHPTRAHADIRCLFDHLH